MQTASIALGAELFSEQLRTSPGYALGAAASLAVLAAGVVMLSIWAPPTLTAEQLAHLPGKTRSPEDGGAAAGKTRARSG